MYMAKTLCFPHSIDNEDTSGIICCSHLVQHVVCDILLSSELTQLLNNNTCIVKCIVTKPPGTRAQGHNHQAFVLKYSFHFTVNHTGHSMYNQTRDKTKSNFNESLYSCRLAKRT